LPERPIVTRISIWRWRRGTGPRRPPGRRSDRRTAARAAAARDALPGPPACATVVAGSGGGSERMAATTTIRLAPKLRARLNALARHCDRSAHSLIVEAVERHVAYEEQLRDLVKEALAADADIDRLGEVYRAEDVHAWMARLAPATPELRPKPWRR
jgi:predicted transcriptional regulator